LKFKINCKLFTLTLRLCWMNYLLKRRPQPFLYCYCRNFSSGGFSHLNTVPFSSKPSHTFRQKTTFEDFPIKPTSEGIKEAKLSLLFVLNVEQLAAATTSGLGTKDHVSMVAHNCHGKTKNLTAKTKNLRAKPKTSWQNQKPHGKNEKPHGNTKYFTAKAK